MTVRSFSEIDNSSISLKKARSPAGQLEQLNGFEFLEAVSKLDTSQIQALDKTRITFIFNQLNICIKKSSTRSRAFQVSFFVLISLKSHFDEQEALCKSLMEQKADRGVEKELIELSNRLFLSGNNLFKIFFELPGVTYGKVYEAICSKNDELALIFLQQPLNFQEKQHDDYTLFDLACSHLSYEVICAFLQKNPYITSNAYRYILHNSKLTSDQKLDLFVQLTERRIDPNVKNDLGNSAIDYAIKSKETTLFNFLLGQISSTSDFDRLIQKAIQANFKEVILILSKLAPIKREYVFEAISQNKMEIVLILVKAARFKWDFSGEAMRVKAPSLNSLSQEEVELILNDSSTDAYEKVNEYPDLYSMENFTLLRADSKTHYKRLVKHVAHAWGLDEIYPIDPLERKPIDSGGNHPLRSLLDWISFLTKQQDISIVAELLKELRQVYHEKSTSSELDKIGDRLNKNELIVCSTGYATHTTYALFRRAIVLYANRGRDAIKPGGSVYIARNKNLAPLIRKAVKQQIMPRDSYFSERKMIDESKLEFIQTTKQAKQSGGFCTLASLKAASFGIMNIKSIDPKKHGSRTAWKQAAIANKPDYKILTTRYRLYVLNGLLFEIDDMFQHEPNKAAFAPFYYHLLLSIKLKVDASKRFSQEQKGELNKLICSYLNYLVDVM